MTHNSPGKSHRTLSCFLFPTLQNPPAFNAHLDSTLHGPPRDRACVVHDALRLDERLSGHLQRSSGLGLGRATSRTHGAVGRTAQSSRLGQGGGRVEAEAEMKGIDLDWTAGVPGRMAAPRLPRLEFSGVSHQTGAELFSVGLSAKFTGEPGFEARHDIISVVCRDPLLGVWKKSPERNWSRPRSPEAGLNLHWRSLTEWQRAIYGRKSGKPEDMHESGKKCKAN